MKSGMTGEVGAVTRVCACASLRAVLEADALYIHTDRRLIESFK